MNKKILLLGMLLLAPSITFGVPATGDKSFTISGIGASDKDFDNNSFGMTFEVGFFSSNVCAYGIRQTVNSIVIDGGGDSWNGATRGFMDYHFLPKTVWLPFVGANIGGVYGDDTEDTFSAGLELGVKYYVQEKTYLNFQIEYQYLFDDGDELIDQFDDGSIFYNLGVGFNF